MLRISFSNNCSVIIIGVCRTPDKSKIPEFTIKLNEILSSTSQFDHVFIVGDLKINLLDPKMNLFNKPTCNENNNPSILDHIWSDQLCDTFNGIFLLDITDHYPIFKIVPINCPQKQIRVKFRDHSRQNIARLKFEVERYVNNHVQRTQDVSSNANNFCNNLFVIYSNCYNIKEKEI